MKTIKIIDLLVDIINEKEVPKKIKYLDLIWEYDKEIKDYYNGVLWLFYSINSTGLIDREVEIIEDTSKENKKIEKLKVYDNAIEWCCNGRAINDTEKDIIDKINEIIDKVNGE